MLKIFALSAVALGFMLQGDCNDDNFESSSYYEEWDKDSDTYLSDREVADGLYGEWDADADGMLSETEFDSFGVEDRGAFADVDADRNSSINRQEFDRRYSESAVFNKWDGNRDGRLDRTEYDAVVQEYGLD